MSILHHKTIIDLFEKVVNRIPKNIAVWLDRGLGVSYEAFNHDINQLAWYLRKRGIGPNVIIGIEMERSYKQLVGIFAILKSGAAYLPIDPSYPITRKQHILVESKVNFLLSDNPHNCYKDIPQLNIIFYNNDTFSEENTTNPPKINNSTDLVYVIYTSGSTGKPKGVMIKHHSLLNRIQWMQQAFPIDKEDRILQKTNFTFDVSVWELFWWSVSGASVYLLPPNKEHDVKLITKIITHDAISVVHFVPSVLRIFLHYVGDNFDINKFTSLRYVFSSGEELDGNTVNQFHNIFLDQFPVLINLYGPTEATIDVSFYVCQRSKNYKKVPIGKPINNIQLFILDQHLKITPPEEEGEIYISGEGLALGYLNDPNLTNLSFIENPYSPGTLMYKTGDLAKLDKENNLVYLERIDDQIKLRGLRIELGEIKFHLMNYDNVFDAVVMLIENEYLNQILAAFVILKDLQGSNKQDLINYLSIYLPNYMIPSYIVFTEKFPLKNNGKVDKEKLKDNLLRGNYDHNLIEMSMMEEQ